MGLPDDSDPGDDPTAGADDAVRNPYTAPGIRPDPGPTATAAIPLETKVLLVVAMAISAGWPVYFGVMLTGPYGRLAMAAALALCAGTVWQLFRRDRDRFDALAKGLLTLGLLSLLPILPMVIGGICVFVVASIIRPSGPEPLDPIAAAVVTILVAGFYIIVGLGIGQLFRSLRQRKERRIGQRSRPSNERNEYD